MLSLSDLSRHVGYSRLKFYFINIMFVLFQSVVVASPTINLQHGEPIVSPISGTFYHPTPASRAKTIPESGKLPRTAVSIKIPSSGPIKLNPGKISEKKCHRNLSIIFLIINNIDNLNLCI